MHFRTQVGHLGGNLSSLDALVVIWNEFITKSDRFILSKGHSAGALYIALHSVGLLTDADLLTFHQDNTKLPAHPPVAGIPAIPFATGSLGHGFSLAAGLALSKKLKQESGRIFCLTSDGEWQEGSTWEALIFATHHQLTSLTVLIDHNRFQGFGDTASISGMDPLWDRLKGFPISTSIVEGHDPAAIREALNKKTDQLHLIFLETQKGFGVPHFQDRMDSHYLPLTEKQYRDAISLLDQAS
jgi:transketolase